MAKGYRNDTIAQVLSRDVKTVERDVKTVERHINNIYGKLQGRRRVRRGRRPPGPCRADVPEGHRNTAHRAVCISLRWPIRKIGAGT